MNFKNVALLLLSVLPLAACGTLTPTETPQTSGTLVGQGVSYTCDSRSVPYGSVITSKQTNFSCAYRTEYVYQPVTGGTMYVCQESRLPSPYVITGRNNPTWCAGAYSTWGPGWTIVPASGSRMDVCLDSPVPTGWRVQSSMVTNTMCGGNHTGKVIVRP